MFRILKVVAIGFALSGAALASANAADVAISFNTGDVAIGYHDGYWDKGHQWHKWQRASHRDAYQHTKGSEYHNRAHTRDANEGWHESK